MSGHVTKPIPAPPKKDMTRLQKMRHIREVADKQVKAGGPKHNLCFSHNFKTYICRGETTKGLCYDIGWGDWLDLSKETSGRIINMVGSEYSVQHLENTKSEHGSMSKFMATSSVFGLDELVDYYL